MRNSFKSIAIAVLLSFAGPMAPAATSPLASAADYIFSTPPSNIIHGAILGPGGDYRVMRAEDAAYLHEALCERAALLAPSGSVHFGEGVASLKWEFGSWPADDTNGTKAVLHSSTNEIIGKLREVTNLVTYLAGQSSGPKTMNRYYSEPPWGPLPRGYGFDFLPPASIAGVAPGDRWIDNYYDPAASPRGTPYAPTNAASPFRELYLADGVPAPPPLALPESTNDDFAIRLEGPPRMSLMTNLYSFVAKHSKLGRSVGGPYIATNGLEITRRVWYGDTTFSTNTTRSILYDFEATAISVLEYYWHRDNISEDFTLYDTRSNERTDIVERHSIGDCVAETSIPWLYATTGSIQRLGSGTLFFTATAQAEEFVIGSGVDAQSTTTSGTFVVSCSVSVEESPHGMVRLRLASVDARSLWYSLAAAVGARYVSPDAVNTDGLPLPTPELDESEIDYDPPFYGLFGYASTYKERLCRGSITVGGFGLVIFDCTFRTQLQEPQP